MAEVFIKAVPVSLAGNALNPVHMSRPAPQRNEIAAWVADNGRLPDDFIAFMMAHNGGTVYPMDFLHNTIDTRGDLEIGPQTSVDTLFTWDEFVSRNDDPFADWRRDHVAVGDDVSSSLILLSLRPQDFGAVRFWWRNINGLDEVTDGTITVGTIAPSFRSFIFEALYVDPESGTPRWRIPGDLAKATKVSF
jgi:hypothetical protein